MNDTQIKVTAETALQIKPSSQEIKKLANSLREIEKGNLATFSN